MTKVRQTLLAVLIVLGGASVLPAQASGNDAIIGCCYAGNGDKCCGSIYCYASSSFCSAM